MESIVQEVQNLLDQGIKEINLVSQDSTFYGRDLGHKEGLPTLLEKLAGLPGKFWIRLLYAYPEEISERLLDAMQADKICSYLDAPFQHSHPRVIQNMRRGMDGEQALHLMQKIRERVPEIVFRTALIVGFPGEGREEFSNLQDFVEAARFEHLGVFTYSPERETASYELPDRVPAQEQERRRRELMELQAHIASQNNQHRIGKRYEVLWEGRLQQEPGLIVGRARFQAPEVDGIVLSEAPSDMAASGVFHEVEIQDSDVYDLYGKIVT
jgi:ribosomal protein S12 methylthiotransferase